MRDYFFSFLQKELSFNLRIPNLGVSILSVALVTGIQAPFA